MIHEGKVYVLDENSAEPCENCPLESLCDRLADDFGINFELCATEENFGEFENPIYKMIGDIKEDEEDSAG